MTFKTEPDLIETYIVTDPIKGKRRPIHCSVGLFFMAKGKDIRNKEKKKPKKAGSKFGQMMMAGKKGY